MSHGVVSTAEDFRAIALSLPETCEQTAWNMPTFRVRGKIFAALNPEHGPGIRAAPELRAELVAADPAKFYWTPHDERSHFMRLQVAAIDRAELRELLTDAWRAVAGPTLAARHGL